MKRLLLLCCFLQFSLNLFSKEFKIQDSLLNVINKTKIDTIKINAMNELSSLLNQYDNDKAFAIANESVEISKKNNYIKGEAKAYLNLANLFQNKANYINSLEYIYNSIKLYDQINDNLGIANCNFQLGEVNKFLMNFEKAISYFEIAETKAVEANNLLLKAKCETLNAHCNIELLKSKKEIKYFNQGIFLYKKVNDFYKEIDNAERLATSNLNLANAYIIHYSIYTINSYLDTSILYSQISLQHCVFTNDKLHKAINNANIGDVYALKKEYSTALNYYLISKELLIQNGNKDYLLNTLESISKLYINWGNYEKAKETLLEHLHICTALHYNLDICHNYKLLSEVYLKENKLKEAFATRELYELYKDSVYLDNKQKTILSVELDYKTKQKDDLIKILNTQNLHKETTIKQQNTIKSFLFICIALILILFLGLYNRYKYKLRISKTIAEKNTELEKLSLIARKTDNVVLIAHKYGEIEWVNDGFFKQCGWNDLEEYTNKYDSNIFTHLKSNKLLNLIQTAIQEKKSCQYEHKVTHKNGQLIWMKTTFTPIYNENGMLLKLIFLGTNITELEVAKKTAEDALQIQEQFLANTSHEIRTPIHGVLGMANLLEETNVDKVQKQYVQAIKESTNNLLYMVNDILDLTKIKSGKIEYEYKEFILQELINKLCFSFQYKLDEKGVQLNYNLDDNIPRVLLGDPYRLNQILLNLISNAIKFTKKGFVNIQCKCIFQNEKEISIKFSIMDSGIGIPSEKLDYIFESFAQAEVNTNREYGGTGLGLSITKSLIEQQNGKISVESKLNKGTTFVFELIFGIGNENWKKETSFSNTNQNVDLSKYTILLVEDNLINQQITTFQLKKWNAKYVIVESAEKAIEIISLHNFDLILMDIKLPIMNGLTATKIIRGNQVKTPIIALTANAFSTEKQLCIEAGMNDYITKPIDNEVFLHILLKYLQTKDEHLKVKKSSKLIKDLDLNYIDKYIGNNKEFKVEMIEMYLKINPVDFDNLQKSLVSKNTKELIHYAHKLKSSNKLFGFQSVFKYLNEIETICEKPNADFGAVKICFENIEAQYEKIIPALEKQLKMIK